MVPVFDGHNDTLLDLIFQGPQRSFFEETHIGHIDLPRAKKGNFIGGFFALFVPALIARQEKRFVSTDKRNYDPLDQKDALDYTLELMALAYRLERESNGQIRICLNKNDILDAIQANALAIYLHIEGAEAIDSNFNALEILYQAGLRSLGPVWSRPNIFGEGAPAEPAGSPDIGNGLTDYGINLIKSCDDLGILIDLSHLNEAGFWDVLKTSQQRPMATHSNAHSISPTPRNLTDKQLQAMAERNGIVGLNFHSPFLRDDLGRNPDF